MQKGGLVMTTNPLDAKRLVILYGDDQPPWVTGTVLLPELVRRAFGAHEFSLDHGHVPAHACLFVVVCYPREIFAAAEVGARHGYETLLLSATPQPPVNALRACCDAFLDISDVSRLAVGLTLRVDGGRPQRLTATPRLPLARVALAVLRHVGPRGIVGSPFLGTEATASFANLLAGMPADAPWTPEQFEQARAALTSPPEADRLLQVAVRLSAWFASRREVPGLTDEAIVALIAHGLIERAWRDVSGVEHVLTIAGAGWQPIVPTVLRVELRPRFWQSVRGAFHRLLGADLNLRALDLSRGQTTVHLVARGAVVTVTVASDTVPAILRRLMHTRRARCDVK